MCSLKSYVNCKSFLSIFANTVVAISIHFDLKPVLSMC